MVFQQSLRIIVNNVSNFELQIRGDLNDNKTKDIDNDYQERTTSVAPFSGNKGHKYQKRIKELKE